MKIDIYADVVCPWCYIGKHRFDQALAEYPGRADVEVTWRSFQLDPEAPTTPVPLREAYLAKLGGAEQADELIEQVNATAAAEGLTLRLDLAQRVNTFDAHRLLALALAEGGRAVQDRVQDELGTAYFVEGRDIADHAELTAIAKQAGLDGVDVGAYLGSYAGTEELTAELGEGRARGLSSVPTFVFEQRWAVSGAQPTEIMLDVLAQVEQVLVTGGGGCCGGGGGGCACSPG